MGFFDDNLTNFGEETRNVLDSRNYKLSDIAFIMIDNEHKISNVNKFFEIADTINYDDGYGSQEINPMLTIYMKDGNYFERGEYDGSEWWDFVMVSTPNLKEINNLTIEMLICPFDL